MPSQPHEVIAAYGVTLRRLDHAHIEQVRQWRNSEAVRRWMEFRGEITPAMQERWFAALDPASQFYYLIEHRGEPIGVVNIKHVKDGSGEGGIFIADERQQNSPVAVQAILAMYDFGFDTLGLREITAHILADNPRAIRFNEVLGFRQDPGQDGVANPLWRLSPADYRGHTAVLRAYLSQDNT